MTDKYPSFISLSFGKDGIVFDTVIKDFSDDMVDKMVEAIKNIDPKLENNKFRTSLLNASKKSSESHDFLMKVISKIKLEAEDSRSNVAIHPFKVFRESLTSQFGVIKPNKKNKGVTPIIKWCLYEDPIMLQDSSEELEPAEISEFGEDLDSYDQESLNPDEEINVIGIETVLATQFGLIPIQSKNLASAYFSFWVGHTNFSLTQEYIELISSIDGVESLEFLTRYRFKIGIGKIFKQGLTMSNISKMVISNEKQKRKSL